MKKLLLLFAFVLLHLFYCFSQNCLPNGIEFTSQVAINSFPANYPGCTGIQGNVRIDGSNITNLNGLSSLKSIGGFLSIDHNTSLANLNGLSNLKTVGGNFWVHDNIALTNISGLNEVTTIGGYLAFEFNDALANFNGFNKLTSVGGVLVINKNASLLNLNGLNKLTSIGGRVDINDNDALIDASGLNAVTTVNDYLALESNDKLTILGFENLSSVNGRLYIYDNGALTNLNGLNSLTSVDSFLIIQKNPKLKNLDGLENLNSIGDGIYIFTNDSLQNINALLNLSYVGHDIKIQQNDALTNLIGLEGISHVNRNLDIQGNNGLLNLKGLDNITKIDGYLYFNNDSPLKNFAELHNLTMIGGSLGMDYMDSLINFVGLENVTSVGGEFFFRYSNSLKNVNSLSNVKSINGKLTIDDCQALMNLGGLDNIDPATITELVIQHSSQLSICEVKSICDYLSIPANIATIDSNATGCGTRQQIEDACQFALTSSSNDSPVCEGGIVNLYAGGGVSYEWSGPNGYTSSDQNPILIAINPNIAGMYSVIITISSGSTIQLTTQVIVNPLPLINIMGAMAFCTGDSTTLNVSGGINYEWNTGESSESIIVSNPGVYEVSVTDGNGCLNTDTVLVIEHSLPAVSLELKDTFCIDEIGIQLSGGVPAGGNYSGSGVSGNVFEPSVAGAGTHNLIYTYTDANGCTNFVSEEVFVDANCTTGTITSELDISINAFPNPSTGNLTVTIPKSISNCSLQIFDTFGRKIFKNENCPNSLEIRKLPKGILLLKLSNDNYKTSRKIIVF